MEGSIYNYDVVLRMIAKFENIPLSSSEIAHMIGKEQSNTAAYIHHLLVVRKYITRIFYTHLDKIYYKNYFRPNITYYKFNLTQAGKQRLKEIRGF